MRGTQFIILFFVIIALLCVLMFGDHGMRTNVHPPLKDNEDMLADGQNMVAGSNTEINPVGRSQIANTPWSRRMMGIKPLRRESTRLRSISAIGV